MDDQNRVHAGRQEASNLQGKGKARRVEQPFSSARHKKAIYCLTVIVEVASGWWHADAQYLIESTKSASSSFLRICLIGDESAGYCGKHVYC